MNRDSGTASRGMGVVLFVLLLVVGVGAASWWAGRTTLSSDRATGGVSRPSPTMVPQCRRSSIGRALAL